MELKKALSTSPSGSALGTFSNFMHYCRADEASLSQPPETLLHIFANLPPESLITLSLVCSDWEALLSCPGSWTLWREWTRRTMPGVFEAARAREASSRKATPCWRSLFLSHKRAQFEQKRKEEALALEQQRLKEDVQQQPLPEVVADPLRTDAAAFDKTGKKVNDVPRTAWKQMVTVVSISSLTTFAFWASMSLAY